MAARRKLTLDQFIDRVQAALADEAPPPRRRVHGDTALLVWRRSGLKAGVAVDPGQGGAFVFLGHARQPVDAAAETVALLRSIFAGDLVEVQAEGPTECDIWLAPASAPAQPINRYNPGPRAAALDVPVFTRITLRAWPRD